MKFIKDPSFFYLNRCLCRRIAAFSFILQILFHLACAANEPILYEASESFKVETMAQGLGVVWGMEFINDQEILFTEREGQFKKLNLKTKQIHPISGAPKVYTGGQGGLMDVALHPEFSKNQKVYFSYSKIKGRKQTTAVALGTLKGHQLLQVRDLFEARPSISSPLHFGSRLVFDENGFLFVTVGDRNKRHSAQSLKSHLGKILRLTDEGAAPPDNPFVFSERHFTGNLELGSQKPPGTLYSSGNGGSLGTGTWTTGRR